MKVLFAVSNENISNQIVEKYQKVYKEIISYKNMYYFNAIVKELQRDKSYDRIVISEDLEPFANNNYDAIDKFLFEKLDNISDEATGINGEDIPIILIASDRRTKSEPILVKLFGIGIYNVLLGQDRSTSNVCSLLNKPRGKKEAKIYYKIEADEVNYKSENEENVSEAEIKNILNHYKRLGKDEDRYIESFNNIAAQYNDAQLRIITKFLPLNVKAVLEERSPKYQSVMTFGETNLNPNDKRKKEADGLKIGFLKDNNSIKPTKPVIVPTSVKKVAVKKNVNPKNSVRQIDSQEIQRKISKDIPKETNYETTNMNMKISNGESKNTTNVQNMNLNTTTKYNENDIKEQSATQVLEPIKRGRGRPKKIVENLEVNESQQELQPKRGRGRPKKNANNKNDELNIENLHEVNRELEATQLPMFDEETDKVLPGFDEDLENQLPGFEEDNEELETMLPGFENNDEIVMPGFNNNYEQKESLSKFNNNGNDDALPGFESYSTREYYTNKDNSKNNYITESTLQGNYTLNSKISGLLSKDKKVVSFIGTTKNGTSFLVNNIAKCLSSIGIKTAILDLTTNRNSYYIYTKNEESLRNIAFSSIKNLKNGIVNGILVDKYLDVYTALPGDNVPLQEVDKIISTLVQNYTVVLMDCDFNTIPEYFDIAQEIYIVQTMDILTIQPMTAFLRELKAKEILKPEKIRIVINKEMKIRGLTAKAIVGGLANYNDPAMSFMTELFNKDTVRYIIIPFEEEACSKYLEGVMDCEISINGYSKNFSSKLKELTNIVYPLLGNKYKPMGDYYSNSRFSSNINNTLEQMKNRY